MKPIERVVAALQHKEADRVPVYPLLNGVSRRFVGASYERWANDADITAEAYIKVTEEFDLDTIVTLTDLSVEASDFKQKMVYPENEAAHPDFTDYLIKSLDDYRTIEPINPRKTPRMSNHIRLCDKLMKAKGSEVPVVAFVFGPLGITSMLRGQSDLYMDLLDDPDAVKSCVSAVTDTLFDYVDALMETGVHAIMFDTLFASRSIMSKAMWREFEAPWVKRLADHVHSKGCMVMIHNCGEGIYFDAQIEAMKPEAISFLHPPDDCADLVECKEKYGSQTTLIGCVSPTGLFNSTPEEIEAECKRHIDMMDAGGGYVLATGCEYPANLSFDAARVIVQTAKTYGRYSK